MTRSLALLVLAAGVLATTDTSACTVRSKARTEAEKLAEARAWINGASAVIDGEVVIRDEGPGAPAVVRAIRIFKGPRQAEFRVGVRTTCDRQLRIEGQRVRLVLTGGPRLYYALSRPIDPRLEDRVLGSDRQKALQGK